jgi:acyl-CoA oxidase
MVVVVAIQDYFAVMETLSYHDLSLVIKFGVQFGLWGMSVKSLGTENIIANTYKILASLFCHDRDNHGSNVKGIETTATYNHENEHLLFIHHMKRRKKNTLVMLLYTDKWFC